MPSEAAQDLLKDLRRKVSDLRQKHPNKRICFILVDCDNQFEAQTGLKIREQKLSPPIKCASCHELFDSYTKYNARTHPKHTHVKKCGQEKIHSCSVCQRPVTAGTVVECRPCNHAFCSRCIAGRHSQTCRLCNQSYTSDQTDPVKFKCDVDKNAQTGSDFVDKFTSLEDGGFEYARTYPSTVINPPHSNGEDAEQTARPNDDDDDDNMSFISVDSDDVSADENIQTGYISVDSDVDDDLYEYEYSYDEPPVSTHKRRMYNAGRTSVYEESYMYSRRGGASVRISSRVKVANRY
jgi:hypothetical protein